MYPGTVGPTTHACPIIIEMINSKQLAPTEGRNGALLVLVGIPIQATVFHDQLTRVQIQTFVMGEITEQTTHSCLHFYMIVLFITYYFAGTKFSDFSDQSHYP